MSKILSTRINSIFLATILLVGTFALMSPSFMNNAQAVPEYDKPQQYPSYKPDYNYKSKDTIGIKKVNCNNANLNVNDVSVNVGRPPVVGDFTSLDTPSSETESQGITANNFANGEKPNNGFMKDKDGFVYVCANNNNNVGQGEKQEPPEPTTASLIVTKTTTCNRQEFGDFCNFNPLITVTANNPNPSSFPASEATPKVVTLGEGLYDVSEAGFGLGMQPCLSRGFDGGQVIGQNTMVCTNISDSCSEDIRAGQELSCTIENTVTSLSAS